MPGSTPNSSARVTETAGACCTTTYLSGSRRAAKTSGTYDRSTSAPVGQTTTHWPQLTQLEVAKPRENAVPITVLLPRPTKSMAATD